MCRAISQTRIRYPWQIIMDKYGLQGWGLESSDNNAIWSRKQTNKKKVVQSGGELELRSLVLAVLGSWWVPHVNLVGIVGKQGSRQSMNKEKAVSWNAYWRVCYCRIFVSFWQFKVLFSIFPLKSIIWIDFKMENHFVTWFRIRYNIWQPSLSL